MTQEPESSVATPTPTNAELGVLRVLWEIGPATVREVHERLCISKPLVYTTTLRTLQVMADKGLVTRDESQRSHIYSAALPADQTQRRLVGDLLARAFSGNLDTFIMQALAAKRATPEELADVRNLLEEYERSLRCQS